jgi:hypothetical protein
MTNATCSVCHKQMDPLAFALENYGVTGAFRVRDGMNTEVDSTGTLVNSRGEISGQFDGARSLAALIKKEPGFVLGPSRAILHLRRGGILPAAESCRAGLLAGKTAKGGFRFRQFILAAINDEAFLTQAGESP